MFLPWVTLNAGLVIFCAWTRRLRSRKKRKTRPKRQSAPTDTPIPAPSATLFRDGCDGLDDGSTGVFVGVDAGSEAMRDIEDITELGDVVT